MAEPNFTPSPVRELRSGTVIWFRGTGEFFTITTADNLVGAGCCETTLRMVKDNGQRARWAGDGNRRVRVTYYSCDDDALDMGPVR